MATSSDEVAPRTESVDVDSRFRPRRGNAVAMRQPDGSIRLRGEVEWRFEGEPSVVSALEHALPGMVESLSPTLVFLSFGNSVGAFDVAGLGRLEVFSGKWGEADFERMLADLTEVATGLPFSSGSSAALPYDRSVAVHDEVLYHAFVYLRHILLGPAPAERLLVPSLELVLRDPHRRFERTTRVVPTEHARRIDPRGLLRMASARDGVYPAPAAAEHLALARQMHGHLPERIEETVVTGSYDTPENRFVKAFLTLVQGTITGMRRVVAGKDNAFALRIREDCDRMERLVRPVLQHGFWQQIGPMIHLPAGSTVLQRRRGYRELFEHWVRLRLATRLPLSRKQLHNLLEAKDMAELYELWCFFTVVREVEALIGRPRSARRYEITQMHLHVPWDLEVRWPNGTALFYNPRFTRSQSKRYSYSVTLRPDIGLQVPSGMNAGLHLLDAKFRVDQINTVLSTAEDDLPDEAAAERRGQFKRGDLYKMHTYHDAIPGARSVWILYPGTETRFFSVSGEIHEQASDLPELVEGVGALPCVPGSTGQEGIYSLLRTLLMPRSGAPAQEPQI